MGAGLARSTDRIAQYYIKLADKLFPVVEVDGGRVVDVVFTRGVSVERQ
jgi:conjugal transfer pilus assembly protein TraB